jgi:hypothetical protein
MGLTLLALFRLLRCRSSPHQDGRLPILTANDTRSQKLKLFIQSFVFGTAGGRICGGKGGTCGLTRPRPHTGCRALRRRDAGNVLTGGMLDALPLPEPGFTGARIVYGEGCTVPDDRLSRLGVTFKQIPYQIEGL